MTNRYQELDTLTDEQLENTAGGANGLLGLLGLDAINLNLFGTQNVTNNNQNRGGLLGGLLLPGLL